MIFALLFSAIIWNLGTWYFGLPSSSSHTLIGSILGVGLALTFMPENTRGVGVNWSKASEVFSSLLVSPLFGFSMAIIIMFLLRRLLSRPLRKFVFSEPKKNQPPPLLDSLDPDRHLYTGELLPWIERRTKRSRSGYADTHRNSPG